MKTSEKLYIYRHPLTDDVKTVVVKRGNAKEAQWEKLELHEKGYKFEKVVWPESGHAFSYHEIEE